MSQITVLAECTVNAFSTITIELVEADETPAVIIVRWPNKSTITHPPALPRDGGRHRQDIRRCQHRWGLGCQRGYAYRARSASAIASRLNDGHWLCSEGSREEVNRYPVRPSPALGPCRAGPLAGRRSAALIHRCRPFAPRTRPHHC